MWVENNLKYWLGIIDIYILILSYGSCGFLKILIVLRWFASLFHIVCDIS